MRDATLLTDPPRPNGEKVDANDRLPRGLLRAFMERKLGMEGNDKTALIAHNRARIRHFLARMERGTALPASLLAFDEEMPASDLQAIRAQLEALITASAESSQMVA